jgi:hypothetical protein
LFQVIANPEKNRLYVTLGGHLDAPERQEAAKAFMAAVKQLEPGFDIVHDMTELRPTDPDGLKDLMRIQTAAKLKGVRSVIRIVRIPLSRIQFERLAAETGWTFETAASVQEADQRLDALGPTPKPEA